MKKLHLLPSDENVLRTFCADTIDRNMDVVYLCNLINELEDCYVVSIDSRWGSGKTFFVKQAKLLLDYMNPNSNIREDDRVALDKYFTSAQQLKKLLNDKGPHATIYYDAWENDNDVDPILSLIYAVMRDSQTDYTVYNERSIPKIVGSIAELVTGWKITQFMESIKGKDMLANIKTDQSVSELMRDFINACILEHGNRLVIFIDEIDRCKPTFAVNLLERIKHFFSDERVTFVFSTNTAQLQHTIKNYYGAGFDAGRYLDKFFDLRIPLPNANYGKFLSSIGCEEKNEVYDDVCHYMYKYFDLQLREITKFMQLTKVAAAEYANESICFGSGNEYAIRFSLFYFVPIIIALSINDMEKCSRFIDGHESALFVDAMTSYAQPSDILWLLNDDESFDPNTVESLHPVQHHLIDFTDRLRDVYNAMFAFHYAPAGTHKKTIGKMTFGENTKSTIMKIVSLLSKHVNYNA